MTVRWSCTLVMLAVFSLICILIQVFIVIWANRNEVYTNESGGVSMMSSVLSKDSSHEQPWRISEDEYAVRYPHCEQEYIVNTQELSDFKGGSIAAGAVDVEDCVFQFTSHHISVQNNHTNNASNNVTVMALRSIRCKYIVNYENIYRYLDGVKSGIDWLLSKQLDNGGDFVIVWMMDEAVDSVHTSHSYSHGNSDLFHLYYYLIQRYVVDYYGVIIVSPVNNSSNFHTRATEPSVENQLYTVISKHPCIRRSMHSKPEPTRHHERKFPRRFESFNDLCGKYIHTRKYDSQCMPPPPSVDKHTKPLTARQQLSTPHSGGSQLLIWNNLFSKTDTRQVNLGVYPLLVTGLGGSGTHHVANVLTMAGIHVVHEGIGRDGAVSWLYAVNDFLLNREYPYGALSTQLLPQQRLQKKNTQSIGSVVKSSSSPSSFLNPRFSKVYHIVRSPLKQIASITTHSEKTYSFALHFFTKSGVLNDPVVKAQFDKARELQQNCARGAQCNLYFSALMWLHWNRHVRSYADGVYRIEEPEALYETICNDMSLLSVTADAAEQEESAVDGVDAGEVMPHRLHQESHNSHTQKHPHGQSDRDGRQQTGREHGKAFECMHKIAQAQVRLSSASEKGHGGKASDGVWGDLLRRAVRGADSSSSDSGDSSKNSGGQSRFKRSAVHSKHGAFTLADIRELDAVLADDIIMDATSYGYTLVGDEVLV